MKEYIKVLESIKQQFESALDDGQNSTDIDAIEAVEDNTLTVEALNMATQALVDFPAMLNQYLGENNQMIIGKDVYEELKYELETLKKSVEPQEWISVKDRLPDETGEYLVYTDDDEVFVEHYDEHERDFGYWYEEEWQSADGNCMKVVAWMPLPSPYKGE